MYNGIGLRTPRGSGTNGYVQRNLSFVKPQNERQKLETNRLYSGDQEVQQRVGDKWKARQGKGPNKAILEHERKREVEVKLMELRLELESRGYTEEEIETRIEKLRAHLMKQMLHNTSSDTVTAAAASSAGKEKDTHTTAAAKKRETSQWANALGIQQDFKEGT